MSFALLSVEVVTLIHDEVLNPGELPGLARDKSLEATLARVENRLAYGMIGDAFDLAATYAVVIARGHCFNDGNKRTAFRSMQIALRLNGIAPDFPAIETGDQIIAAAQGLTDEAGLAEWLRLRASA
ncbi:MAG: type II toxin-antitoxin system death-on-curing family toxin [Rhodobacteraceae bacterium]|nr:type II toxin-antitoxin system death-on-curing family toxin [Paracoccaceae bacterium]